MSVVERRTRYRRPCPVPECTWWQTTAWFVGSPDVTEEVSDEVLRVEAETHLLAEHYTPDPSIFIL
jgi:hypothetical protein